MVNADMRRPTCFFLFQTTEVSHSTIFAKFIAKFYEITTLTLVKYEYLRRLWPRNTKMYVMTVTEAAILQEFMLWT